MQAEIYTLFNSKEEGEGEGAKQMELGNKIRSCHGDLALVEVVGPS